MKRIHVLLIGALFLLLDALIVIGCKQPTVGTTPGKSSNSSVTITVKGDSHVIVHAPQRFTVAQGTAWRTVRENLHIAFTQDYELAEWRLNSETGTLLIDSYLFTNDAVVFAISKLEESTPDTPIDPAIFKTDGHGTIIGYTCAKEDLPKTLVIPDKIGEEVITKIGEKAFIGADAIKKLDMSQMTSLKTIESSAFCYCHNLRNIKFPTSLERIEDGELDTDPRFLQPYWYKGGAFSNCENLTKLEFPEGSRLLYIGGAAFQDCFRYKDAYAPYYPEDRGLPNIDLSNCTMLTEIGNGAFSGNCLLQEIKLPPSINSLGRRVFNRCGREVDNGIAELDLSACTSLKTLHRALFNSAKIKILKLPTSIEVIEDGYVQQASRVGVFEGCHIEVIDLSACTNLTRIGKWAFVMAKIKEVKFPSTIETIALEAFCECKNLSGTVTFPAGLKTIEEEAFAECSSMVSPDFSACTGLETIGKRAFAGCVGITGTVTFPAGLKTIGESAFIGNDNKNHIHTLDFSACTQLEEIKDYAFSGCSDITRINLTGCGVKTIGAWAFKNCTALPALDFSGCTRLETIGKKAFAGCTNIAETLVFPASLKKIEQSAFGSGNTPAAALTKISALDFSRCSVLEEIGVGAFERCSGITSINFIGCGVKTIGAGAFENCTALPALELSGCTRLETIGEGAFAGCLNIAGTLQFPATLKKIERSAFTRFTYSAPALTKISALDFSACTQLKEIEDNVFSGCSGITGTLTLPASLEKLKNKAFEHCTGITAVHLKSGTLKTPAGNGDGAFKGCTALKTLIIDSGAITFNAGGLVGWNAVLETVILKGGVTSIGAEAFDNCKKLHTIDMSACTQLTAIGTQAFFKCTGLQHIHFPSSLKTLEEQAFCECTALTTSDFSACTALENIGTRAFKGCTALPSVNLLSCTALKSIGEGAFYRCTDITEIKLPVSLISIGSEAFAYCKKLASLNLSGCSSLKTIGNEAFTGCTGITGTVTFPAGLKTIGEYAFSKRDYSSNPCTGIQGLDFSACTALETIEKKAFAECTAITGTLTLPQSLKNLGDNAFNKTQITSLDISGCSALTFIGSAAFSDCTELAGTIRFPVNLKKIASSAFADCSKVTSLDFSHCTGLEKIEHHAFANGAALTTVLNFSGCTGLEILEEAVFRGCNELSVLSLPASLKTIDSSALYACKKLPNINISGCTALKTIGENAFSKCNAATVTLPASVQTIGSNAFGSESSEYCLKVSVPSTGIRTQVINSGYDAARIVFDGMVTSGGFYFADATKTVLLGSDGTHTGTIHIPPTVVTIVSKAFYWNTAITDLDFAACTALKTIEESAFGRCENITSADFSACTSLKSIEKSAFSGCKKAAITLPASIETIGKNAFSVYGHGDYCEKITVPSAEIRQKVIDSDYPANRIILTGAVFDGNFYFTDATKTVLLKGADTLTGDITIPATVKTIEEAAFFDNTNITGVDCSGCSNLVSIKKSAFERCNKLEAFKFPASLTVIGNSALSGAQFGIADLSGCTALNTIDGYAFDRCIKTIVVLPPLVQTIGKGAFGTDSGSYCKCVIAPDESLKKKVKDSKYEQERIIVGHLSIQNGFYFADAAKTVLLGSDGTHTGTLHIPSSVVKIERLAFVGNKAITGIDFSGCTGLTAIGEKAFDNCREIVGLVDLSVCTALNRVNKRAFNGCTKATIKLPASIQTVELLAFSGCQKVQVPNEEIKQKVRKSNYPESKIELY